MLKAGLPPAFLLLVDGLRNADAAHKPAISEPSADAAENLGDRRGLFGGADLSL
jgi:hypothetical protein